VTVGQVIDFPIVPRVNFTEGDIVRLPDGRIGPIRRIRRLLDAATGRVEKEDAEVSVDGIVVAMEVRRLANPIAGCIEVERS
jgi:hypothetical protein